MREEYDVLLSMAWHNAVLTNSGSKIPPLDKLLNRKPDPTVAREGDDADQIEARKMIAALMGTTKAGTITTQSAD